MAKKILYVSLVENIFPCLLFLCMCWMSSSVYNPGKWFGIMPGAGMKLCHPWPAKREHWLQTWKQNKRRCQGDDRVIRVTLCILAIMARVPGMETISPTLELALYAVFLLICELIAYSDVSKPKPTFNVFYHSWLSHKNRGLFKCMCEWALKS